MALVRMGRVSVQGVIGLMTLRGPWLRTAEATTTRFGRFPWGRSATALGVGLV